MLWLVKKYSLDTDPYNIEEAANAILLIKETMPRWRRRSLCNSEVTYRLPEEEAADAFT